MSASSWPTAFAALLKHEGGYVNHWADGANDVFFGLLIGGDDRQTQSGGGGGLTPSPLLAAKPRKAPPRYSTTLSTLNR